MSQELAEIEGCSGEHETDAALLVLTGEGATAWIPKSQIHDDSEVYEAGTTGTLVIPEWLAIEKGLV